MYLLTQESKTWKIEEEARLRFSALNESDAKGQIMSECIFDVLNFPKNQRKI